MLKRFMEYNFERENWYLIRKETFFFKNPLALFETNNETLALYVEILKNSNFRRPQKVYYLKKKETFLVPCNIVRFDLQVNWCLFV